MRYPCRLVDRGIRVTCEVRVARQAPGDADLTSHANTAIHQAARVTHPIIYSPAPPLPQSTQVLSFNLAFLYPYQPPRKGSNPCVKHMPIWPRTEARRRSWRMWSPSTTMETIWSSATCSETKNA